MRARTVVEHDLLQRHDQTADITRLAGRSQATEPRLDIAFRHAVAYEDADLLMGSGGCVLKKRAQFFVELLAGAHTGELDPDILIWPQARQQNQVSGQIDDLDRVTHIQDADLAARSDGGGLQDELASLGDGHEEAAHIGMGDGDRSARGDLLLEDGDDAAVGAEDVAEAHGDKHDLFHVSGTPWTTSSPSQHPRRKEQERFAGSVALSICPRLQARSAVLGGSSIMRR